MHRSGLTILNHRPVTRDQDQPREFAKPTA